MCEYAAITVSSLKLHKKSMHEVIRYHCDQCVHAAISPGLLKSHKKTKHEGIRYSCDQCEYNARQPSDLKKHKDSKHTPVICANTLLLQLHPSSFIKDLSTKVSNILAINAHMMLLGVAISRNIKSRNTIPKYIFVTRVQCQSALLFQATQCSRKWWNKIPL